MKSARDDIKVKGMICRLHTRHKQKEIRRFIDENSSRIDKMSKRPYTKKRRIYRNNECRTVRDAVSNQKQICEIFESEGSVTEENRQLKT